MKLELLNKNIITKYLTHDAPWSDSHGADGDYLGFGLFYYALVYSLKARVIVILLPDGDVRNIYTTYPWVPLVIAIY